MEEKKETNKKPTYEELNDYCNQLYNQNMQLHEKLRQMTDMYSTIPVLFDVIRLKEHFSDKFVQYCAARIEKEFFVEEVYNEMMGIGAKEVEGKEES